MYFTPSLAKSTWKIISCKFSYFIAKSSDLTPSSCQAWYYTKPFLFYLPLNYLELTAFNPFAKIYLSSAPLTHTVMNQIPLWNEWILRQDDDH